MSYSRWVFGAAIAVLGGGCQLIAGVRTDGQLTSSGAGATGATTTGGTGGATGGTGGNTGGTGGMTGGTGGMTGGTAGAGGMTGGTGGTGGCAAPADCPGGACLDGKCVLPSCVADGVVFDVLTADELTQHSIDAENILVTSDGDHAHFLAYDQPGNRLIGRTLPHSAGDPLPGLVTFDGAANSMRFVSLRLTASEVLAQGRYGDGLAELSFPISGTTIQSGGAANPFPTLPAECTAPNFPNDMAFGGTDGAVKFAVKCQSQMGAAALAVGGSDEPTATVVASGDANDPTLQIRQMTYLNGQYFLVLGTGETTVAFYRAGAAAADLATANTINFAVRAGFNTFVADLFPSPAGDSPVLFAGSFMPPPNFMGTIYGGFITDLSAFAQVPPTGMTPLLTIDAAKPFKILSRIVQEAGGYFASTVPIDGKSVGLFWFDAKLQVPLLSGAPVFTVPEGDDTQILGTAMAESGFDQVVIWVETKAGATQVRGQRLVCNL